MTELFDEVLKQERELAKRSSLDDLYDGWMDRQFEKLQMVYCVDCRCFIDPFDGDRIHDHDGHILATTIAQKTAEEVIARLSE